jgi:hypothetical protein
MRAPRAEDEGETVAEARVANLPVGYVALTLGMAFIHRRCSSKLSPRSP